MNKKRLVQPWGAVVVIDVAANAAESRRTSTDVRVDIVQTRGAVDARVRRAFVEVSFAVTTREPGQTLAFVVSQQIHALASVMTRL